MVAERKKKMLESVVENMKKYNVIGMVDMYKLPAKQLQDIKRKMKDKAKVMMVKKRLIKLAIKQVNKNGLDKLIEHMGMQPALLFTNTNPFEIAKIIDASKSPAAAKAGDVATKDIVIPAGPTSLKPGPVIGELQRAKLPVAIEGEKIVVKEDTLFINKGEEIDAQKADVLAKLGIEPMEIGLNMVAAYDNGVVYTKDILFVPQEKYIEDIKLAHQMAFNLAFNTCYITKETLPLLLRKAYSNAINLCVNASITTKDALPYLLSKAYNQMMALKGKMPENKT